MSRIKIQPYGPSRAARELALAAGVKRINLVRTRFRPRQGDVIVNWGSAKQLFDDQFYLNKPSAVYAAGDKLMAYKAMKEAGVPIPAFTTDPDEAQGWVDGGAVVVCRNVLRGHSGEGIGLVGHSVEDGDHTGIIPRNCPLFTRYIPKYDEYRVHVWRGEVVDVQQKRRRIGHEPVSSKIRNSKFGWVFCRENVECPRVVIEAAVASIKALSLDFGASDIGYTRSRGAATVYEVNTAPGLEGATLAAYSERVRHLTTLRDDIPHDGAGGHTPCPGDA